MDYDAGYEVAKTNKRPAVAKALKEMLQDPDLGGTVSGNATSLRESLDEIALKITSDQANISTTVSAEITKHVEKLKDSMPGNLLRLKKNQSSCRQQFEDRILHEV